MSNKTIHKKASSLIEIIIVLAIVSFTIIASMSLVAKTRLQIKNNELQDNANGVLVKAIESLKTANTVSISTPNGTPVNLNGVGPYYFKLSISGSNSVLAYQLPGTFTPLPKEGDVFKFNDVCKEGTAFYSTDGANFKYCQQVAVTPILRAGITRNLYKIDTTIIYQTSSDSKATTLTTYRYGNFATIK